MNNLSCWALIFVPTRTRKNSTYSLPKEGDFKVHTMPLIHFIRWRTAESLLTIQNLRPAVQFTLQMGPWIWKSTSTDEHEQHHKKTWIHPYIQRNNTKMTIITKAHVSIETEDRVRASIRSRAKISRTKSEHVKCTPTENQL